MLMTARQGINALCPLEATSPPRHEETNPVKRSQADRKVLDRPQSSVSMAPVTPIYEGKKS